MTMNGWLEATIHVPTGGWPIDFSDNTNPSYTVTIPAGTYCYSNATSVTAPAVDGIVNTLKDLLVTEGKGWTCALGTDGLVTFTNSDPPGTITWDAASADIQAILGFSANVSSTPSTSDDWPIGFWEPDCALQGYNSHEGSTLDEWHGRPRIDVRQTMSRLGDVRTMIGQWSFTRDFTWPACTAARTWIINESTTNESFERFYRNVILGEKTWARVGGGIGWNWERKTAGTDMLRWNVTARSEFAPTQIAEQWTGRYRIELPGCVLLPAYKDHLYF